jgi:superfamily II DNA/RNA helicase
MPKNNKPGGGRPARNFDPAYAPKRSSGRPGSRSPKHRGFREDEPVAKKARWNADERTARATERDERPARSDRGARDERPARSDRFSRDERPARSDRFSRDERPARSDRFSRDERPARSDRFSRDERPARNDRGARDERPARNDRFSRDERPRRDDRGARDERPARNDRFSRDERPRRDDRGARDERPARNDRFSRDERPARNDRFARDDRPRRDDRAGGGRSGGSFSAPRETGGRYTPQDDVVLERLEADAIQAKDVEGVTFGDLGLGGNITRALAELGAESPFPIQAATIPDVLAGRDVLGRGRTGSGKTIAFGAPLVEKLMENGGGKKRQMGRKPRALVLAPTRELALQIDGTIQPIARSVGLFTTQIYGGVPQGRQAGALQRGVDIVIGTPGRIEDLIEQGRLDLSEVVVTVLDEADHMCDLGFLEPVQRILRKTSNGGQKLLFSATLDRGVASLVDEFLKKPAVHEVAGEDQASSTIDHRVLVIEHRDKDELIERLANRDEKTLIFARTRAYAERLTDQLEDAGILAVALHGDLNQARRTRNLEKLTSGRVNVLVATDVAARGIHVDDITLVVQADAPDEYKTYMHRSGRTGRAGKEGTVVTLITRSRQRRMAELLERAEIDADFVETLPTDDLVVELASR